MVWLWLALIFLAGGIVICVLAAPPAALVNWFTNKFELHPQISDATVTFNGTLIDDKDKRQVIESFNKAIFVERYGFLPEAKGTPLVIKIKDRKDVLCFSIFSYDDHVDVFRENGKKMVAYRLLSESLQQRANATHAS
ncbi:MAG: YfmQ family protein [Tuberibacillus sp.]